MSRFEHIFIMIYLYIWSSFTCTVIARFFWWMCLISFKLALKITKSLFKVSISLQKCRHLHKLIQQNISFIIWWYRFSSSQQIVSCWKRKSTDIGRLLVVNTVQTNRQMLKNNSHMTHYKSRTVNVYFKLPFCISNISPSCHIHTLFTS